MDAHLLAFALPSFTEYLNSGHAWLFLPFAVAFGALHGFEPGHSKTMMAAFIIAIRGTVIQAVLLGLAATASHTAVIWTLAAIGLHYSSALDVHQMEPYFQLATGVIVMGMAYWIYRRTRRESQERREHNEAHARWNGNGHSHSGSGAMAHGHSNGHGALQPVSHGNGVPSTVEGGTLLMMPQTRAVPRRRGNGPRGGMMVDTGHGWLEVTINTEAPDACFRIYACKPSGDVIPVPKGAVMAVETSRLDGSSQRFAFEAKTTFWESTAPLPSPHRFVAVVTMSHGDHAHKYRLQFDEEPEAAVELAPIFVRRPGLPQVPASTPEPAHPHHEGALHHLLHESLASEEPPEYQDAHQRAHAEDLQERFADREVTTWQIILFGLTGGLMPCPAAFTILLMCLHVKKFALGMATVLAFSVGLALTLVSVGVAAALSLKYATRKFKGLSKATHLMPYLSAGLMAVIGLIIALQGGLALR